MRNRASKMNGQTFQKKANAVWRKIEWTCTYKHLEKQTNVVFGKNKRTNIS